MDKILTKIEDLKIILAKQIILSKEILTLDEAALYLLLSKSCIYKMTSNKEIPYYVPGGKKIYFRRSELDKWIIESRITPMNEINLFSEKKSGKNSNNLKS
jgi:excisionase family DNA binding protein